MPSNRKRAKRTQNNIRVTPRMVELFIAGDVVGLDHELGRMACADPSPIEATTDEPPPGVMEIPGLCWRKAWPEARALNIALQEAADAYQS